MATEINADEPPINNTLLPSCANDPNFAVICAFLQKFASDLGLDLPNFKQLTHWLTRTDEVAPPLRDMQIKLLRKTRKTVHEKSWESALSKFCFTYSSQDGWEIERFGYKNSSIKVKLRILRELLESQFERNSKFRAKILTQSADSLRSEPIGRDRLGHAYWVTQDSDCNLRIYQEHLDEEIWQVVATSREEFVNLIERLRGNEVVLPSTDIGIDEDTSSSNSFVGSGEKVPPPEERDDSQEDDQKVPKLSIKLINGKSPSDKEKKDVGKGEEELAAEEDARLKKKAPKGTESCDEEFEEIEEEYEDESDSDDEDHRGENNDATSKDTKTVQPLFISQNQVKNSIPSKLPTNSTRKRPLHTGDPISPTIREETQLCNDVKKMRPTLLDSKRSNRPSKYEEDQGEEDYEESSEDEDDVEEVEEEDIDSAAAEEDENEEKQIEDFDDDDEIGECIVGNEITDPVVRVAGEGSGKQCRTGNVWSLQEYYFEDEYQLIVGDTIAEAAFLVRGEGYGNECFVGNIKIDSKSSPNSNIDTCDREAKSSVEDDQVKTKSSNILPGTPELIGMSPLESSAKKETSGSDKSQEKIDIQSKQKLKELEVEEKQNVVKSLACNKAEEEKNNGGAGLKQPLILNTLTDKSNLSPLKKEIDSNALQKQESFEEKVANKAVNIRKDTKSEKQEENVEQFSLEQANVSKKIALESLKKELRESKQKSMEKNETHPSDNSTTTLSTPVAWNRKRRLDGLAFQQCLNTKHLNSESEIDINSENPEEVGIIDQDLDVDEKDIGGKRLKMRQKQNNAVLRKKVEAQKAAANDETTSSSGGEEGSRRRRKIVSPKKHTDRIVTKTEPEGKTPHEDSSINNTNGQHKKCILDNAKVNIVGSTSVRSNASTSNSSPSVVKHKPTLAEIIEIKLKKTQNNEEKSCVSLSSTDEISSKSTFSPPKKSPVTKPLKKNLLTQIRQDESDEEAIPRKRTVSDSCKPGDTNETKPILSKTSDNQRVTPERQRKRHSSEEKASNQTPEEPEAKKEVLCEEIKKEDDCDHKNYNTSTTDQLEKDTISDEKVKLKEDPDVEQPSSACGRRSGRRGTVPVVYTEISQAKRTRGFSKNTNKVGDASMQQKPDVKTDSVVQRSEEKINIKKEDRMTASSGDVLNLQAEFNVKSESDRPEDEEKSKELVNNKGQFKVDSITPTKATAKGTRKQQEVDATNIIEATDAETPVRQSRRIAQQKIREEAERRKLEEIALRTMKQELKKKKKAEQQFDPTVLPPSEPSSESEESDMETKKKVQKRKCPGKNGSWSSGSEEQEEPDDEEYEEHHRYETDVGSPLFKSDHEFSPESDIEDETQLVPMKRARTARKENAAEDEQEEEACQKCNKSDHPEWILLCDKCDKGYHCSCLLPVLFYIPEGDWYCPPCQQDQLIKSLEEQLNEFDNMIERKKIEEKRLAEEEQARQEEEKKQEGNRKNKKNLEQNKKRKQTNSSDGTNTNSDDNRNSDESENDTNKLTAKQKDGGFLKHKSNDKRNRYDRRKKSTRRTRTRAHKGGSESDSDSQKGFNSESTSKSGDSSSSFSDSDNEPIYKLRKRRQINVSYRLNEYDDLINSALKKEMDDVAGAGNLGRGKDISTIIEADKEEKARQKQLEEDETKTDEQIKTEPKTDQETDTDPKKEDKGDDEITKPIETDSDDEPIKKSMHPKPTLKKKPRKLTTLDISSEDDDGSDEDFKGSSIDDEEDDTSASGSSNSDSSLEIYKRKGKSKKKRRKAARRAFRERRKDRRFVVDESDDDEDVQRPKSKKKRKDDSDYTETEVDDDDLSELSENINSADLCDDTTTDESDKAWCPNKRKKSKKTIISAPPKITKAKPQQSKKSKKLEYSDDDISESEEEDENDEDENIGVGGGKQPRSQPLIPSTNATKTKAKAKGGTSSKTKKKKKSSEEELSFSDSGDSTRRTRGRRYAYIEDFDDDSSDGGIKPGVQRPDTPPEEREKFIKRQEEIKRMLAEKNAEGAKLAATPRLTPIKSESEKEKRSPSKGPGDSLSTVPLSVIRQAKVLDIDYLQRRGENLDDLSVDDDFDDADLPDDLPEDMDEDAIARMVEEEEDFGAVAVRDLPPPDEVMRLPCTPIKPKTKEVERSPLPTQTTSFQSPPIQATASGLQEPVRKRLPMPTIHPPLLRHQLLVHDPFPPGHQMIQRHSAPLASHLLQNALCAPLSQSLPRTYPIPVSSNQHSLLNRMTQNMQLQPIVSETVASPRAPTPNVMKSTPPHLSIQTQEKHAVLRTEPETKPRGRRKKITPLRDTLQKQQTAAAVAAASAASTSVAKASNQVSLPPSAIKVGPPTSKGQIQTSVITSLPSTAQPISGRPTSAIPPSAMYPGSEGFFGPPGARMPPSNTQRHRGPPQMSTSLLTSHSALRPSYGPPPPLKGAINAPNILTASGATVNVRAPLHLPPYVGGPSTARHSGSHLNLYGPSIYGNPNFGPRGSMRPSPIHSSEYPTGSRAYPPYGFYPPPPPLTTPPSQTPRAQTNLQRPPPSVIVSSSPSVPSTSTPITTVNPPNASVGNSSESIPKSAMIKQESHIKNSPKVPMSPTTKASPEPRKKLTTLEAYTVRNTAIKSPLPLTTDISTSQTSPGIRADHLDDSSPPATTEDTTPPASDQQSANEGPSEFSGLVSYFSSQHDDYNT